MDEMSFQKQEVGLSKHRNPERQLVLSSEGTKPKPVPLPDLSKLPELSFSVHSKMQGPLCRSTELCHLQASFMGCLDKVYRSKHDSRNVLHKLFQVRDEAMGLPFMEISVWGRWCSPKGEPKVTVLGTQWLSWVLNHKKRRKGTPEGEAESCESLADDQGPEGGKQDAER